MQKKLYFTALISILAVLFLVVSVSSSEEINSLQITFNFPQNNSIVTEELFSNVTVFEKEYWLVKSGKNQLEINESIGPSSQGVVDFIDDDDLSVLDDKIFLVNGKKYVYEQFIHFDNPAIKVTADENNNLSLKVAGNEIFARYELNFLWALESMAVDSEGNPAPDGEFLPDFLGSELKLLGKKYTLLHASRPEGNTSIKLILMAGDKSDILLVGESKIFTINSQKYAAEMISVNGNNVQLEVNGELVETQSDTVHVLNDGTPISANIFWAGEEPVITLFFNAEKITLRDDDVTDSVSTYSLAINDETIDNAEVVMAGQNYNVGQIQKFSIDSIQIKMIAKKDYSVPANGILSDAIAAAEDQKEVLMNGLFDIEYHGLNEEGLPLVYVTGITKETKKGLPLKISTDENIVCSYSLGEEYQEMEVTGGTSHSQNIFDLVKGQDYEVSVQCEDEFGNSNTQSVSFHVAEDTTPPQITITFPEDDSIVTSEMLSEITVYNTESWKVENSADLLEFKESINDVINKISKEDLAVLNDGAWLIDGIGYQYEQYLSFEKYGSNQYNGYKNSNLVTYEEDDDDITTHFFKVNDNHPIATYKLEFTSPAQSKIEDKNLADFLGTTLTLFGKEYYVFKAERLYQNSVKLILMNNFVSDSIGKDEIKTFSLNNIGYEIIPTFLNEEYVQLRINGEKTPVLKVGERYVTNGVTLAIEDIPEGKVAFIFSVEVLELQDINIADNLDSDEVIVNSETIDGAKVKIKGIDNNSVLSISSLEVDMTAQDDFFVPSGETMLGQPELTEKDLLFTQNWDIKYGGWTNEVVNMISLQDRSGETEYELVFANIEGNEIELPLAYLDDNGSIGLGDQDNRLKLENSNIADEQYFILNNGTDKNSVSNVIQYKGADNRINDNTPKMKFKILATGEIMELPITFEFNEGWVATASLELVGVTYIVTSVGDASNDDYNISVTGGTDTSSSNAYGWENYVIAKGGARIDIIEKDNGINVSVNLIDSNAVGDSVSVSSENPYLVSSVDIVAVGDKVDFTNYAGIGLTFPDDDEDNSYGYALNGAFVKLNNPSGPDNVNSDTLEIEWPEKQRLPLVYVTAIVKSSTKPALPLEVSTDENAVCSYSLGEEYPEMETTGGKFHSQNLFDLEEKDYLISVKCIDQSENSNTEKLNFHFGEIVQEQPSVPAPPSSGGGGGSSSSKNDDEETEDKSTTKVKNSSPLEVKKNSEELVPLLAEASAESSPHLSLANSITAAVIGVAEKGGLLYVAGFVLFIFSLIGIKIFKKN